MSKFLIAELMTSDPSRYRSALNHFSSNYIQIILKIGAIAIVANKVMGPGILFVDKQPLF